MTCAVLLCFDSAGASPRILRDDEEALLDGDGVRFRLAAETDDHG